MRSSRELLLRLASIAGSANRVVAAGGRPSAESFCCVSLNPSMIRGSSPEDTVRGRLRATRATRDSDAQVGKHPCCAIVDDFVEAMYASMAESAGADENANTAFSGATEDILHRYILLVGWARVFIKAHSEPQSPMWWPLSFPPIGVQHDKYLLEAVVRASRQVCSFAAWAGAINLVALTRVYRALWRAAA